MDDERFLTVQDLFKQSLPENTKFDINKKTFKRRSTRSNPFTFECDIWKHNSKKKKRVFVKITFDSSRSAQEIEISKVLSKAVKIGISPHFPLNYNDYFGVKQYEKSGHKIHILITEILRGVEFTKTVFEFDKSKMENAILQTVFALHVLHVIGLSHNDFHLNNIMIVKIPKKVKKFEYKMMINGEEKIFSIPNLGFRVKIFDFDGSVKFKRKLKQKIFSQEINNPDETSQHTLFNSSKPDFYRFLRGLSKLGKTNFIANHVDSLFPDAIEFLKPKEGVSPLHEKYNMLFTYDGTKYKELTDKDGYKNFIYNVDYFLNSLEMFQENDTKAKRFDTTKLYQ